MAQHRTIQVFTSTRITKKKSGEEERGTKWIQREKFPPIIQIAAWCLNPHHCSPHQNKSINQLEISEKLRTQSSPSSCSRYTLESWCGKAAHDSQSTMGKNNKNSTRRDSSKKISATRKLHLSIKPLLQIHITFASQEIVRCPTSYIWLSPSWGWLKLQNHTPEPIRCHSNHEIAEDETKIWNQLSMCTVPRALNDHDRQTVKGQISKTGDQDNMKRWEYFKV